jgi:hypothetical protein
VSVVAFVFPLIVAAAILLAARAVGSSARRGMRTMTPDARVLRLRALKRGSIYAGALGLVVALAGISGITSRRGPAVGLEFLVSGLALLGVGVFGYLRLRGGR